MMAVVEGRRVVLKDREHFLSLAGKVSAVFPEIDIAPESGDEMEQCVTEGAYEEILEGSEEAPESGDGEAAPRKRGRPRKNQE